MLVRVLIGFLTIACSSAAPPSEARVDDTSAGASLDVAAPPDAAEPVPDTEAGSDTVSADTGPGEDALDSEAPPATGVIGSPCAADSQCLNDAVCLDWSGGYCTRPNCVADADCPDLAVCAEVLAGTTACLAACGDENPCRTGYGCKPFGVGEERRSACIGLEPDPAPSGGACTKTAGCAGPDACLAVVAEGYCAVLGCDATAPCPADTACVLYNGAETCLRVCQVTEDCLVGGATKRECGALPVAGGSIADVCLPSSDGALVGSQCSLDVQCASGTCRIVAKGKCAFVDSGCFVDEDCPGAAVCEIAPAYEKGVCTQACGPDVACPGKSACVLSAQGGFCQTPCKGLTDAAGCDQSLGERCLFGDPLANTSGGGKYLCAVTKPGDPGEPCATDEECKGGSCNGTCTIACPSAGCPFPTVCVDGGDGASTCQKRCFQSGDCPAGMGCETIAAPPTKVCVPK